MEASVATAMRVAQDPSVQVDDINSKHSKMFLDNLRTLTTDGSNVDTTNPGNAWAAAVLNQSWPMTNIEENSNANLYLDEPLHKGSQLSDAKSQLNIPSDQSLNQMSPQSNERLSISPLSSSSAMEGKYMSHIEQQYAPRNVPLRSNTDPIWQRRLNRNLLQLRLRGSAPELIDQNWGEENEDTKRLSTTEDDAPLTAGRADDAFFNLNSDPGDNINPCYVPKEFDLQQQQLQFAHLNSNYAEELRKNMQNGYMNQFYDESENNMPSMFTPAQLSNVSNGRPSDFSLSSSYPQTSLQQQQEQQHRANEYIRASESISTGAKARRNRGFSQSSAHTRDFSGDSCARSPKSAASSFPISNGKGAIGKVSVPKSQNHSIDPSENGSDSLLTRHVCPYPGCDKHFSTSGHARRHSRIHYDLRPFECPHEGCSATFTRRDNCTQHQRARHAWQLTAHRLGEDE